ncbi:hypothetical protein C8R47DRAFT_1254692 [Mycena vitilis]|nr:hypothetical protein C8R47DRAFT_1254692 [Mycena vitilis]
MSFTSHGIQKLPIRRFDKFVVGQVIHCDHKDSAINETAQSLYHNQQTTDKIRPCLLVGIDFVNQELNLAPFTEFIGASHPGWCPIAGYITNHDNSHAIWVGVPSSTTPVFDNTQQMYVCRGEGVPPQSETNIANYLALRQQYMQNTEATKYFKELKSALKRVPIESKEGQGSSRGGGSRGGSSRGSQQWASHHQPTSHRGGHQTAQSPNQVGHSFPSLRAAGSPSLSQMGMQPAQYKYNSQQPMYAPSYGSNTTDIPDAVRTAPADVDFCAAAELVPTARPAAANAAAKRAAAGSQQNEAARGHSGVARSEGRREWNACFLPLWEQQREGIENGGVASLGKIKVCDGKPGGEMKQHTLSVFKLNPCVSERRYFADLRLGFEFAHLLRGEALGPGRKIPNLRTRVKVRQIKRVSQNGRNR